MGDNGIRNAKSLGPAKVAVLGVQHLFAMFGATVLVPVLTGLDIASTLMFAGLGTLMFHAITKFKIPAFLGSSFAFLGGYSAIKAYGLELGVTNWVPYAGIGVAAASLIYVVLSIFIKMFGTRTTMRFFPPIVTGPIIISIGLILASSAIDNCSTNWFIAILAVLVIMFCNIWGKGMIQIIPILMGVLVSYILAAVLGRVDFTALHEAAWFGFPVKFDATVFSLSSGINVQLLIFSLSSMVPIALATVVEHIGDMCAISSTVGENFILEPGLNRSLLGDGVATGVAALFGAPANTTYGENTGVLALSKVYDPMVVRIAAILSILLAFCPKFAALISCMPAATVGGVSLILYGMISAVGVRNVVENQVDFTKSRHVIIAALIMSLALGINFSSAKALSFELFGVTISLSGLAVAAIVGIFLNAMLPGNDYVFGQNPQGDKAVNLKV